MVAELVDPDEPLSLDDVEAELRDLRSLYPMKRTARPVATPAAQLPRLRALAAMQAGKEAGAKDVLAVRTQLPERLLREDEIATWLEEQAGVKSFLLLSNDTLVLAPKDVVSCVSRLTEHNPWRVEEALAFLLTGATPSVQWADVTVRVAGPDTRITLNVDPESSPRSVMALYAQSRKLIQAKGRIRPMTEKAAALAQFVFEQPKDRIWRERMTRWNKQVQRAHSEWQYDLVSNFHRDGTAAFRRLSNPGWSWSDTPSEEDAK